MANPFVTSMKIFVLTVTVLLSAGYTLSLVTNGPGAPSEAHGRLLADVGEEIQVVVCSATSARTSSLRNSELVSNIVNGLPDHVKVLLLVNDRKAFRTPAGNRRVTFIELPSDCGISIWPQDPFVVVEDGQNIRLVTPCRFDREDDRLMPIELGKALEIEVVRSELYFEGGNIVCGTEAVFTGIDTIKLNAEFLRETASQVHSRLEETFGRPLVVVGKGKQAIGHLDLVVTPLGGKRVAVADSRWGANLAQQAITVAPTAVRAFESACEEMFFGHPDIDQLTDRNGHRIDRPKTIDHTETAIHASLKVADELDMIAAQISQAGYEVFRIPSLVPDLTPRLNSSGKEMVHYPFLSYSNVLLETRNDRQTVYLPQYGLAPLDEAAAQRWRELGFDVNEIPGFATSSMYGGALRCSTKVLMRGTPALAE